MVDDPIVEEVHQAREQLLAQYQGSFEAYFASLMQAQQLHPEKYLALDKSGEAVQKPPLTQRDSSAKHS